MSAIDTQANGAETEPRSIAELARAIAELEHENSSTHALLTARLLELQRATGHVEPAVATVQEPTTPKKPRKPAKTAAADEPAQTTATGITYRVTSPMMKNDQLRSFQRLLNRRFADWKIDYHVDVDGEYGPKTRRAAKRAAFALGIAMKDLDHGLTPDVRHKIRHPELRSAAEKQRAAKRHAWVTRLRKRYEGGGPAAAIQYARQHLGVTESPPGSNRGPLINKWNRAVGTPPGPNAFWCGAFANACLVAAGFTPKPWMKSCIQIEQQARGRVDGWSWHASPEPGDLVLYSEKGVAGHVGLVERMEGGTLVTIEGNTSRQGATSSQSNGGGVFERHRNPHDPSFPVRGYARPPYRG